MPIDETKLPADCEIWTIADETQREAMLEALQSIEDQHHSDLLQAAEYRREIEKTRKA